MLPVLAKDYLIKHNTVLLPNVDILGSMLIELEGVDAFSV